MPTPDNLNRAYLGQPGSSDNLTTAFLPETASEATINARSDISTRGELHTQGDIQVGGAIQSASAISGGAIAGTTGNFGSTMSIRGITTVHAALNSASAISAGAITGTTGTFTGAIGTDSAVSGGALTMTTGVFTGTIDTDSAVSMGELTATGGNFLSPITSTDPGGDFGSIATAANDTGMADGAFRFVNAASGVSIAYRSGGTTYYLGGSTISEA